MSITAMLLEFLMNLLKDPKAAADFLANPQGSLDSAGLGSICTDDVDAVTPVLLDSAPIAAIGGRVLVTGGNSAAGADPGHSGGAPSGSVAGTGGDALPPAVAQLTHVVNNFSYTSIDDRDTITDQSVHQNIWAVGDVTQLFDNQAIVAAGDGAVAAGHDATVDKSVDNSVDNSTTATAGGDVRIGTSDVSVTDSFKDSSTHSVDNSVAVNLTDSLNDSSTHSVDNSVALENSLNSSSDHSDHSVDNSVHTNLTNSLNDNSDHSLTADASFNTATATTLDVTAEENSTNFGDLNAQYTSVDDSTIVADSSLVADDTVEQETAATPLEI